MFTKANVLCHDLNELTTSVANLDILLGFNTSDIIWLEPVTQKYTRLNKNGSINKTAVKCISWLPHSENLFIAAHMDGSLIVYDRDKEDAPFVAEASPETGTNGTYSASSMYIKKSVQSRNQKTNPVSNWNLGLSKINAISFSPDGTHLAVVSEDGTLKILDFLTESLLDIYKSYYGGLLSVTWSPDGRYILTGGQDDLVSIWSFADSALVARCPGHSSWVTDVKFDPWRCDERNYRFGSIGEDRKLLLWDFSVGMLGKPKGVSDTLFHIVGHMLTCPVLRQTSGKRHFCAARPQGEHGYNGGRRGSRAGADRDQWLGAWCQFAVHHCDASSCDGESALTTSRREILILDSPNKLMTTLSAGLDSKRTA